MQKYSYWNKIILTDVLNAGEDRLFWALILGPESELHLQEEVGSHN